MNRNLDGCYFRVQRNGRAESICFTDLTREERDCILEGKDAIWLTRLCNHLADVIQAIGEELDIISQ